MSKYLTNLRTLRLFYVFTGATPDGKLGMLNMVCAVLLLCITMAIPSRAQTLTTLLSFDYSNGAYPQYTSLVQGSNGDLYGTTYAGGTSSAGTVFEITPSGALTTLYSFCAQPNCSDGQAPDWGLVMAASGNFYGTTVEGGVKGHCPVGGCGTIFEITPSGTLTTLYSFCAQPNCSDGQSPAGPLVWTSSGALYGATELGGITNNICNGSCGTAFTISPGGELTTLHSFDGTDGGAPLGGLVQGSNGDLFGTTFNGGANDTCPTGGCGTVFQMTTDGSVTTLYSFCSQANCTDGATPYAGLVQGTDGNFYGTTVAGGQTTSYWIYGAGTVFKISPGGTLTTLHKFDGSDGGEPTAQLVLATDGNFYGTTEYGGTSSACAGGCGTIFRMTPDGTLTTLYSFCVGGYPCADGYFPGGGLVQASNGEFYGTTGRGGTYDGGTIFSLSLNAPKVKLSPDALSFGNQALNETSAAKAVTLTNTGTAPLSISSITPGGSFAVSSTTCGATLAVGKKCKVSVTFSPTVLGKMTGTLTFTDSAPTSPQTVALSGTGVLPATLAPVSATYAKQVVGTTSAAKTFSLINNQTVALTDIAISTTGDFAVSATTCTTILAAKGKCTISVTVTPTQTGTRMGQLSVSDSASNSPQTSALKGTGK